MPLEIDTSINNQTVVSGLTDACLTCRFGDRECDRDHRSD
jgi:hypothetical protein